MDGNGNANRPTLEELTKYCKSNPRLGIVDPKRFMDWADSRNWTTITAETPVKSWWQFVSGNSHRPEVRDPDYKPPLDGWDDEDWDDEDWDDEDWGQDEWQDEMKRWYPKASDDSFVLAMAIIRAAQIIADGNS